MLHLQRRDLQSKSKLLKKYEGNYKKGQKKLYAEKMMGTLNEKYEKLKVKEAVKKKNKEKVRDGEKGKGWVGTQHAAIH